MLAKLSVVTRDGRERVHPILDDRVYILGRGERVDIRVPDNSCSRSHCIIEKKGDAFTVFDLTSSNGTLLNGQRLGDTTSLSDGDEIQIGETRMRFSYVPDQERFALLTEVPEEGEFDPLAPAKRFVGWREGVLDSSIIEPQDSSSETRMINVKDLQAAEANGFGDEESDDEPAVDLEEVAADESGDGAAGGMAEAGGLDLDTGGDGGVDDSGQSEDTEVAAEETDSAGSVAGTESGGDGFELEEDGGGDSSLPANGGFELEPQASDAAAESPEFELEESEAPAQPKSAGPKPVAGAGGEAPPPPKKKLKPVPPPRPAPPAAPPPGTGEDDFDMGEAPPTDPEEEAFARHVVELGFLDEDKVSLARMQREMESSDKPLGMYLVDRKLLNWDQLKQVLAMQQSGFSDEAERRWTKRENVLFGKLAVKKEFISGEQLEECLAEQKRLTPKRNIGEILVIKGFMTKNQVEAVLRAQQREVLRCTECDAAYMVGNMAPGRKLKCKTCGTMLTVPEAADPR